MDYLLLLEESGHDHRTLPYEVRGGFALPLRDLWPMARSLRNAETYSFGRPLAGWGTRVKGARLLDRDRFRWAAQMPLLQDGERKQGVEGFFAAPTGGDRGSGAGPGPTRLEFTAYGQACLQMARSIFHILKQYETPLFGTMIPRRVEPPGEHPVRGQGLRRDHLYLLERFYYFLQQNDAFGVVALPPLQPCPHRGFIEGVSRYLADQAPSGYRQRLLPVPLGLPGELAPLFEAADVVAYCLNHTFRLPTRGMDAPLREEIARDFNHVVGALQYRGRIEQYGRIFESYGIVYVGNPYE